MRTNTLAVRRFQEKQELRAEFSVQRKIREYSCTEVQLPIVSDGLLIIASMQWSGPVGIERL
jgi:hypothetical protein